ncbi:hypothetical protein EX30DRAFT_398625, partial [Ascodesmis nigricans]
MLSSSSTSPSNPHHPPPPPPPPPHPHPPAHEHHNHNHNHNHNHPSHPPIPARTNPPVPIAKLPNPHRPSSTARENMNCKNCRKRKIKCSRTRPSCTACDMLRSECVYDAVPKKRGPKTEVLEELTKRIEWLERKLVETEAGRGGEMVDGGNQPEALLEQQSSQSPPRHGVDQRTAESPARRRGSNTESGPIPSPPPPILAPSRPRTASTSTAPDISTTNIALVPRLVDVFFSRINGKPYNFFHEPSFRASFSAGTLPAGVINAVCAAAVRYIPAEELEDNTPQQYAESFANTARAQVDADEPTLENLQAMLILSMTFYAMGYGRKAWMQMGPAIRMTLSLDLHRELPASHPATPLDREIRRRVFWTCYLMDRFTVSGSLRPPQLSDRSIHLRLPCPSFSFSSSSGSDFTSTSASASAEAPFFSPTRAPPTAHALPPSSRLITIVRILGRIIKYTQSGGLKGDSHFPWHCASHLSRIRAELESWSASSGIVQSPIMRETSPGEATTVILSWVIYHVSHLLLFRPFLPVEMADIEPGTHGEWQRGVVGECLRHAREMVRLVREAEGSGVGVEWPAFVGFALATAGGVLVHGEGYGMQEGGDEGGNGGDGDRQALERVLGMVERLRGLWVCMAQHLCTLRLLRLTHHHLLKHPSQSPRPSVFHLDDFFDRYALAFAPSSSSSSISPSPAAPGPAGGKFESCHVPFIDTPNGGGGGGGDAPSPVHPHDPLPPQHEDDHRPNELHPQLGYDGVLHHEHHKHGGGGPSAAQDTAAAPNASPYNTLFANLGIPGLAGHSNLNITDLLFPHELGFSWSSDWPVDFPSPSHHLPLSPQHQHQHHTTHSHHHHRHQHLLAHHHQSQSPTPSGTTSEPTRRTSSGVNNSTGTLGFRKTLYDPSTHVPDEILPFAVMAAELEEDDDTHSDSGSGEQGLGYTHHDQHQQRDGEEGSIAGMMGRGVKRKRGDDLEAGGVVHG